MLHAHTGLESFQPVTLNVQTAMLSSAAPTLGTSADQGAAANFADLCSQYLAGSVQPDALPSPSTSAFAENPTQVTTSEVPPPATAKSKISNSNSSAVGPYPNLSMLLLAVPLPSPAPVPTPPAPQLQESPSSDLYSNMAPPVAEATLTAKVQRLNVVEPFVSIGPQPFPGSTAEVDPKSNTAGKAFLDTSDLPQPQGSPVSNSPNPLASQDPASEAPPLSAESTSAETDFITAAVNDPDPTVVQNLPPDRPDLSPGRSSTSDPSTAVRQTFANVTSPSIDSVNELTQVMSETHKIGDESTGDSSAPGPVSRAPDLSPPGDLSPTTQVIQPMQQSADVTPIESQTAREKPAATPALDSVRSIRISTPVDAQFADKQPAAATTIASGIFQQPASIPQLTSRAIHVPSAISTPSSPVLSATTSPSAPTAQDATVFDSPNSPQSSVNSLPVSAPTQKSYSTSDSGADDTGSDSTSSQHKSSPTVTGAADSNTPTPAPTTGPIVTDPNVPTSIANLPTPHPAANSTPGQVNEGSALHSDTQYPTAAPGPVQLAQMVNRAAQSAMRIGFNTASFGSVEVRTMVHANDVGLSIGSEKGDLRSLFTAELPAIAGNLQQQNLRLTQVSFHQQGSSSSNNLMSGGNSQSKSFSTKQELAARPKLEPLAAESSPSTETICERNTGLSILA